MNDELVVQVNNDYMGQPVFHVGGTQVMITPLVFVSPEDKYWWLRIELSDKQALVAFPKFGTIGIGFESETDWNTNLPYQCHPMEIYHHISHNKGDKSIHWSKCVRAIKLLQKTIADLWSDHSDAKVKEMHERYLNESKEGGK